MTIQSSLSVALAGLVSLSLSAAASAQLTDARFIEQAEGGQLWLAFETQPARVETRLDADGLSLHVLGVPSEERRIEAAGSGPVGALILTAEADGVRIALPGAWMRASAELRQGGVLVHLAGSGFDRGEAAATARVARAPTPPGPAPTAQLPGDETMPAEPAQASSARRSAPSLTNDPPAAPTRATAAVVSASGPGATSVEPAGPCAQSAASVSEDPWDLSGLVAHAGCLVEADQTAEAAALYTRVLAFEPTHFEAAMGLGALRAAAGDTRSAESLFEQAAGSARTDGDALRARSAARRAGEGD
ncbi:MAG: tetratricopeptide repeat protein [Pseudomonadota bacterium]